MIDKKILIVDSGYLLDVGGTAETMRTLFSCVPKNKILNFCVNPFIRIENREYMDRVLILPEKCAVGRYMAGKIYSTFTREKIETSNPLTQNNTEYINSPFKLISSNIIEFFPLLIDNETKKRIIEFNPDVIYTTGSSFRVYRYVNKLTRLLKKKVVIHYLDDYINNNRFEHCGPFRILYNVLLSLNQKTLRHSNAIMCISPKMAIEYSTLFHKEAYVVVNTMHSGCSKAKKRSAVPKLLYCGGMNINRDRILIDICKEIDRINGREELITLDIYSKGTKLFSEYYEKENPKGVNLHSLVPHDEMQRIIEEVDICVYAENLDSESEKYCRLSFSTKIGEYMAASKPIFCIAPQGIAVSEYLSQIGNSYIATDRSEIGNILDEIIQDQNYENKSELSFEHYSSDLSWQIIKKNFENAIIRSCTE